MTIETKIIIGLIAVAVMGLAFGVPLHMLEKKYEKQGKKSMAIGVYAIGYIMFYIMIIWYWIGLLGEADAPGSIREMNANFGGLRCRPPRESCVGGGRYDGRVIAAAVGPSPKRAGQRDRHGMDQPHRRDWPRRFLHATDPESFEDTANGRVEPARRHPPRRDRESEPPGTT